DKRAEGLTEAVVPDSMEKIYLHKAVEATNRDVAEVRAAEDDFGSPAVEIVFTKAGADKMRTLSGNLNDKRLAILFDGKVVSAPVVRSRFGERAIISGLFTKE